MDPADLPDGIAEFSESILGITFHGSARVIIIIKVYVALFALLRIC